MKGSDAGAALAQLLRDYERVLVGKANADEHARVTAALKNPDSELSIFLWGVRKAGACVLTQALHAGRQRRKERANRKARIRTPSKRGAALAQLLDELNRVWVGNATDAERARVSAALKDPGSDLSVLLDDLRDNDEKSFLTQALTAAKENNARRRKQESTA